VLIKNLIDYLDNNNLTQQQLANLLGVSQPRISNIIQKKLDLFSLETLLNFLEKLGFNMNFIIKEAKNLQVNQKQPINSDLNCDD